MIIGPESFKLRELRAKTDRDLAALVSNQIESALKLRRLGLAQKAQCVSDEARNLLRVVDASQRHRLEAKLRLLADFPCTRAACS